MDADIGDSHHNFRDCTFISVICRIVDGNQNYIAQMTPAKKLLCHFRKCNVLRAIRPTIAVKLK